MRVRAFPWPAIPFAGASIFFAIYLAVGLNRLCALRVGSNTGEYLQAAVRFLHTGSTFNYVDWNSTLAMHDQWMFLAVAPLAAFWPHPEVVIAVQVLALAAAAPLVYRLVRDWGGAPETAAILAIVYLVSPSVQGFAFNEFVPLDFVPLLSAALLLALQRGRWLWALLCVQLLCGTKEDVALFVVWFAAIYAALRDRRLGLAAAGLAALNLVVYYALLGFGHTTVHPQYGLADPNWPKQLAFTLEILAPFAFAPLALGWRILFAAPLCAELFFARWSFPLYQAGNYYTIALVTVATLAGAYVLAQRPRWARIALGCAVVMALFFNTTVLHFGRHLYRCDPLYPVARAWSLASQSVTFPCDDQGAWTVAAGNIEARLTGCVNGEGLSRARAMWGDAPLASTAGWTRGPR
ncbi:MAG TPA: DUF2079 domain-containing protein [Verrucomicrobiae bacterium]|nr:DUF2079 domain-containing protein [Verrucomicrobiae bacterium]